MARLKLNRHLSDAVYWIDTGCSVEYLVRHLGSGSAHAAILLLSEFGLLELENSLAQSPAERWLRLRWDECDIRYEKGHYTFEGTERLVSGGSDGGPTGS